MNLLTWVGPAVRGGTALTVPLLIGMLTGSPTLAVVAAVGALWGVGQDGDDPYRARAHRLVWLGLAAAGGLCLGELALRSGSVALVTVCLVLSGFVAGLISPYGRPASVAGMHLLLGAVIGSGIPVPGPWWQPPLALLSGTLLVLALSLLPWLWSPERFERAAIQAVFRAAAQALAVAGTPAAEQARRGLTDALDTAHDVMAPHLARAARDDADAPVRYLVRAFHLAVALGQAVTTLLWEARPLPPAVTAVPTQIARRLLERQDLLPEKDFQVTTPGLRALADTCAAAGLERTDVLPLTPPRHRWSIRPGQTWSVRSAHLRYALLLALCVLVAQLGAIVLDGPRGYWLPMTVAFVYKPDFGPVLGRAVNRCLGTVVGVAGIGALVLVTDERWLMIGAVAGFGALMAVGVRRHYAVATTGLTGVVFVLLDMLGDHRILYWPRILDTALAAALVLVVHFLLWPRSAADRAQAQTEAALAAAARYAQEAPAVGPAQRHALRREAYQQLAQARRAVARARQESSSRGRGLPGWEEAIADAERGCDAVTALSVAPAAPPQVPTEPPVSTEPPVPTEPQGASAQR